MDNVSPIKREPEYTPEQYLKIENFKLKVRISQLQQSNADLNARLYSLQLNQEKLQLDNEFGKDWLK